MAYRFDLVSEEGEFRFVDRGFKRVTYVLAEFQPATRVRLIGLPPSRIRVWAEGEPAEVAPGILKEVEVLAGVSLRYELAH